MNPAVGLHQLQHLSSDLAPPFCFLSPCLSNLSPILNPIYVLMSDYLCQSLPMSGSCHFDDTTLKGGTVQSGSWFQDAAHGWLVLLFGACEKWEVVARNAEGAKLLRSETRRQGERPVYPLRALP